MLSRNEYLYLKVSLEKREKALFEYMNSDECFKWNKWCNLSQEGKEALIAEWNTYYDKVKESPSYQSYLRMKIAFDAQTRDINLIHKLAVEASARRLEGSYLPKPSSVDPSVVQNYGAKLFQLNKEVDEIKTQLEDYGPVYEKREQGADL